MIFKGKHIVFFLFLLTAAIGAMFIYLGPKAIQSNPGVLHLGIRYSDEFTVDFTRFPKGGPGAVLEIYDLSGQIVQQHRDLSMGRNLIPIHSEKYKDHLYTIKISAPSYKSVRIQAQNIHRTLIPAEDFVESEQILFEPNLIGVRLKPLTDN